MGGFTDWAAYVLNRDGHLANVAGASILAVENFAGSGKIVKITHFEMGTSHAAAYAGAIMGIQMVKGSTTSGGTALTIRALDSSYPVPATTEVKGWAAAVVVSSALILKSMTFSSASIEHANGGPSANYWHRNLLPVGPGDGVILRPGESFAVQTILEDAGGFFRAALGFQITDSEETALLDRFDTLNETMAEIRAKVLAKHGIGAVTEIKGVDMTTGEIMDEKPVSKKKEKVQ